ncbi:MAG TPA: hypothetical protein VET86_10490 [Casimicrobiaceae bacterium]|nr:hypothetical protein [Casimicrobiaceae bacterium]
MQRTPEDGERRTMQENDGKRRGSGVARVLWTVAAVVLVAMLLWGSDQITLQGERTIYTVDCEGGTWQGRECSSRLVPAKRYAFRASKSRNEVLYWIRGSDAPSGRYSDCKVTDRDNWSCNVASGSGGSTIAFEMVKGRPTPAGSVAPVSYHSVPKWKWWLMDAGFHGFKVASD